MNTVSYTLDGLYKIDNILVNQTGIISYTFIWEKK